MRKATVLILLPLFFLTAGCADLMEVEPERPQLTPLQVQSLQQRDLETAKPIAFASVVSVLQDLGYTIGSADQETGFITAAGLAEADEDSDTIDLIFDILADEDDDYDVTTVQTKATAFVEAFGEEKTRVRLSFVKSRFRSGSRGQNSTQDKQILDAEIYRNAFDKIENAIFVRESSQS